MPTDYNKIAEEHARDYGTRRKHLGIYRSLYSNKTHFIYEVIQNANDACARKLTFLLRSDELIIHNDGRPFVEKDVRSICSIGRSTKDLTKAGAFGIGFKAVYAYTSSPEIYSGGEHFRIREFVIPEDITTIPPQIVNLIEDRRTILRLPFSNKLRPTEIEQLQKGLRNLHPWTLLFLRNLESICWSDEITGESGEYSRRSNAHPSIANSQIITLKDSAGETKQDEMRFMVLSHSVTPPQRVVEELLSQVEGDDEEEAEEELERIRESAKEEQLVEIAFSLIGDSISPLTACVFFSYFPTEKGSHLRFLLQARYQTTPARDNIPDGANSAWNGWLVEETASFLPTVIKELNQSGYISPSFFDVLPLEDDEVSPILQPVVDSLSHTMRENKYVPVEGEQYEHPRRVFYPHAQDLRKLLTKEDFYAFTKTSEAFWLHPEIRDIKEHERRFKFIQSIGVRRIDAARFITWFSEQGATWLKGKSDEWLRDLYLYLSRQKAERNSLKELSLIRLENGEHVTTQNQSIFFQVKGGEGHEELTQLSNEVPLLRTTLLDGEAQREIELFLRDLGIKPLKIVEIIRDWLIPRYGSQPSVSIDTARLHLRFLLNALDKVPAAEKRTLLEELKVKPILLAKREPNGSPSFVASRDVYLPSTYTGVSDLEAYFAGPPYRAYFLDEDYLEAGDDKDRWQNFLLELGCATIPRLIPQPLSTARKQKIRGSLSHGYEQEEGNTIMEGLETFFSKPLDYDRAMLLWNIIGRIDVKALQGKYQWDNDYRHRSYWQNAKPFDTDTLTLLKDTPWLLDSQNIPRKPSDLFADIPENRRLLGDSVSYLHPDIDLTDKPVNTKSRTLAITLGVHLRADTAGVINYIRSLSGTDVDPKVARAVYRFLDDNHAKPVDDFTREKLLLAPSPQCHWWKSTDVFWEDESIVFGQERGYLEHYYQENLKLFFLGVGVEQNAQPLDYLKVLQTLSLRSEITSDTYIRIRNLYRRLWVAIQEGKKLRDNDEQKLIDSTEWAEILVAQTWLGRRDEKYDFYRLEQLVWNDHSYIAHLFEESLPFWDLEDLREFRDYLKVQPCSHALVSFHPQGLREKSIIWSEKIKEQLQWLRIFLKSPRWEEQHSNVPIEELDRLQVWLVEQAVISYTLKGIAIRDPEPCLTYLDNDGILWITSEAAEEEYPDQIGDALQSYFRVNELREFVKDLLTRRLEDVLRIWQKRGLEVPQSSPKLEQSDSSQTNTNQENEEIQTTDEESEQSIVDYINPAQPTMPASSNSGSLHANVPIAKGTESSGSAGWGWQGTWGGGGGESDIHRNLKERVAANPNLISAGLKLVSTEYEFPSLDRVDILLVTEQGKPVPVEIKTYIVPGDYKGVWQAVKYKHLAAILYNLRCEDVRSLLVAHEIPDDVKAKCVEMGIEMKAIPPKT